VLDRGVAPALEGLDREVGPCVLRDAHRHEAVVGIVQDGEVLHGEDADFLEALHLDLADEPEGLGLEGRPGLQGPGHQAALGDELAELRGVVAGPLRARQEAATVVRVDPARLLEPRLLLDQHGAPSPLVAPHVVREAAPGPAQDRLRRERRLLPVVQLAPVDDISSAAAAAAAAAAVAAKISYLFSLIIIIIIVLLTS
jgi:hypothetical protein